MNESYPRLIEELNELRRQWRLKMMAAGFLTATAAVAGMVILTVAADNLLKLGTGGRLALALVVWATLVAGLVVLVVRRGIQTRRDDFFAAMVEQKHSELHNLLVNALQLGRGNSHGSARLIDAIIRDAATATADLQMTDCLDRRPVKRAAVWAGVGAVLVGAYAALFGGQFANGLARVLMPTANIAPYSKTQIVESSIKPGNARVPEEATVAIQAEVEGVTPEFARLMYRNAGKPWRPAVMQTAPSARRSFQFAMARVTESFEYYITAGDGHSRIYRVEVVKRPEVETLDLVYSLPAYAAQAPQKVARSNGEIASIAGTTVTLELKATKPLKEATLVTDGEQGQVVALGKGSDDRTWSTAFLLWSQDARAAADLVGQRVTVPRRYHLRMLDTDGYDNGDPLWHSITLAKDQPPTVAIASPARDLQLKPDDSLNLVVDAKDDYGLGAVQVVCRINDEPTPRELTRFEHAGKPELQTRDSFAWKLADTRLKPGDLVQYWAVAVDRNTITGPGRAESRRFSLYVIAPQPTVAQPEAQLGDFAQVMEELVRLQRENRAQTTAGVAFETLVIRQVQIRALTSKLARAIEKGGLPLETMVQGLDELARGLMPQAVHLFENGRDTQEAQRAAKFREQSLPVQDQIIEQLQAMLARLQRNEQARESLRKLEKTDKPAHKAITEALGKMVQDLDRLLSEEKELATKFEKMPKKPVDELNQESLAALKDLDKFQEKWGEWAKGKVDELAKLPTGFVDDFGLRADAKKIFEEIEKAAQRRKTELIEVSVEDIADPWGKGQPTRMKEDLDIWMPDVPDYQKWVLEEPFAQMNIPEMPLPDSLQDMMGDLLQKEEEFDQEADDVTSAWGANLDQAGWLAVDGNMSVFSAKGITANDMPNSMELTGRSGDGRRGRSSGQMVGDTARGLQGRKTPARVGAERYEPGNLKVENQDDPRGATGGGKKAGAGQKGLQGGTPPDFVRDMQRLGQMQAQVRERAEQVAKKLDVSGAGGRRLTEAIDLMKSIERDYRDLRYEDAARKRRVALGKLDSAKEDLEQPTGVALSRARQLPAALRQELLQSADEGYPAGYEEMLKSYFRALSETEK